MVSYDDEGYKLLVIFLPAVYDGLSVTHEHFMRNLTILMYCPSFLHFAVCMNFPHPIDTLIKLWSHGIYTM
jgi:hypothetical protein